MKTLTKSAILMASTLLLLSLAMPASRVLAVEQADADQKNQKDTSAKRADSQKTATEDTNSSQNSAQTDSKTGQDSDNNQSEQGRGSSGKVEEKTDQTNGKKKQSTTNSQSKAATEAEFLLWFKNNYPRQFKNLDHTHKNDVKLYQRQLTLFIKKYDYIRQADKRNPELGKVFKQDLSLKTQEENCIGKIREATDNSEKQQLIAQLRELLSKHFDVTVNKKRLLYAEQQKRLEKLRKTVENRQREIEKFVERKDKEVQKRLDAILSGEEKINW